MGLSSPELNHGNDRADHFVGEGAKIYQVDHRVMNFVHMVNFRIWVIQERLLHISIQMADGHQHSPKKKPLPHYSPPDTTLTSLGHQLATAQDGWQECMICCQWWHKRTCSDMIQKGPCPGARLWEPGRVPDIPAIVTRGSDFVYAGHIVHRTHQVAYKMGLVVCLKCGALSHGAKVICLSDECSGQLRSAFTSRCIRNFRVGRHPHDNLRNGRPLRWPLGRRAPIPEFFKDDG